ncbi:hypothetical protein HDU67_002525 [Dinochytrium kinnereticum]|nr:hypothetical protein HDU67_002525 [Dinochytrium kinnereticum]
MRTVSVNFDIPKDLLVTAFQASCAKYGVEIKGSSGSCSRFDCTWRNLPQTAGKDVMATASSPEEAIDMIFDDMLTAERELEFTAEFSGNTADNSKSRILFSEAGLGVSDVDFKGLVNVLIRG